MMPSTNNTTSGNATEPPSDPAAMATPRAQEGLKIRVPLLSGTAQPPGEVADLSWFATAFASGPRFPAPPHGNDRNLVWHAKGCTNERCERPLCQRAKKVINAFALHARSGCTRGAECHLCAWYTFLTPGKPLATIDNSLFHAKACTDERCTYPDCLRAKKFVGEIDEHAQRGCTRGRCFVCAWHTRLNTSSLAARLSSAQGGAHCLSGRELELLCRYVGLKGHTKMSPEERTAALARNYLESRLTAPGQTYCPYRLLRDAADAYNEGPLATEAWDHFRSAMKAIKEMRQVAFAARQEQREQRQERWRNERQAEAARDADAAREVARLAQLRAEELEERQRREREAEKARKAAMLARLNAEACSKELVAQRLHERQMEAAREAEAARAAATLARRNAEAYAKELEERGELPAAPPRDPPSAPEVVPGLGLARLMPTRTWPPDVGETAESAELQSTSATINLCDPVSLMRIRVPVRFRDCKHFQCFDFAIDLPKWRDGRKNRCPLCTESGSIDGLIHDRWFGSKLETTPPDHKFVEFDTKSGETLRTYSDRGARKRKAAEAGSNRVDLCDDAVNAICIEEID